MENAQQAYDIFNRLWQRIPRSVRLDRENHQLMLDLRTFFDGLMAAAKRAAIVGTALAAKSPDAPVDGEEGELPDPVRQALRVIRVLDRREWEMVKSIADLFHKFSKEDFLDIVDIARDVSCPQCGEWLDDDDPHENCPNPEEGDEEGEGEGGDAGAASAAPEPGGAHSPMVQTSLPAVSVPASAAESGPNPGSSTESNE